MARAKRTDSKGHVLRQGESQETDGRYRFKWSSGGVRHTISASTLAELREQERQIQKDEADGIQTLKAERTSLNELFAMCMDSKSNIRASTRANYISTWNFAIKDGLGTMIVSDIRPIHIRKFYTNCVNNGKAANTVKLYHNLIFAALEMAVDNDLIRRNPAKNARKDVGGQKNERKALTAEQEGRLLAFVESDRKFRQYYPMILFALSTGLRIGELTALQWSDIDREQKTANIRRQLIYKNLDGAGCKFYVGDLKTSAGARDIPLVDSARKALAKQRELDFYFGKAEKRQNVCGFSDYIFTNHLGAPYAVNAVNFVLRDMVKAYNETVENEADYLPHVSAHILRHTFCSRAAEAGVDPKSLQTVMGHSDVSVTLGTYTHLDYSQIQKQMEKAEKIIQCG